MSFKLIAIGLLSGLLLLFILQNFAIVEIQFLLWSVSIPRSLLIFIIFSCGLILGWSLHSYARHRKKRAKGGDTDKIIK